MAPLPPVPEFDVSQILENLEQLEVCIPDSLVENYSIPNSEFRIRNSGPVLAGLMLILMEMRIAQRRDMLKKIYLPIRVNCDSS